jgi:hypothetical protein
MQEPNTNSFSLQLAAGSGQLSTKTQCKNQIQNHLVCRWQFVVSSLQLAVSSQVQKPKNIYLLFHAVFFAICVFLLYVACFFYYPLQSVIQSFSLLLLLHSACFSCCPL